jgi:hypothetical protein
LLRPHLGGPFRRGTRFKVTDTVLNDAPVGMPRSTTTRYSLSADTVRSAGDTLLTGGRTIQALGPTAGSSGSVSVAIRATTRPGTYVLLACADDVKVVAEGNKTNSCRASGTPIAVSP